jgi:hypothetical protein
MAFTDEVMIDELRFPRMVSRLRKGRMISRCNCVGCPPCKQRARRLVRGIVRNPQLSKPYRPEVWGDRFRQLTRWFGNRAVNVITDNAQTPSVLDVDVGNRNDIDSPDDVDAASAPPDYDDSAENADSSGEEFEAIGTLLEKHSKARQGLALGTGGALGRQFVKIRGTGSLSSLARKLPTGPGVYLIQWRGGQYLGKSDNLQSRVLDHAAGLERFRRMSFDFDLYYSAAPNPRDAESNIFMALKSRLSAPSPIETFRPIGMTNKSFELESEMGNFG